ncbi:hypothetical protein HU200_003507 [Digitaria exilis]|uniref:Uncharacterized protein n=1 Tax=Digitaria exilis TaxID=1010633 RepID=A0A835FXK3_9POAL|nr:hypothetical protein HU200_003507 [Digitaria exilis]
MLAFEAFPARGPPRLKTRLFFQSCHAAAAPPPKGREGGALQITASNAVRRVPPPPQFFSLLKGDTHRGIERRPGSRSSRRRGEARTGAVLRSVRSPPRFRHLREGGSGRKGSRSHILGHRPTPTTSFEALPANTISLRRGEGGDRGPWPMLPNKWKVVEGGGGGGGCAGVAVAGDQRRRCVAASLSMLIAATLAFLAYVAFFPNDGAGGLYRLWSCQDCAGELLPGDDEAADGPSSSPRGVARAPTTLSHIVFGIGASARTWDQRRGYAELWWRPGQMRGHVWLDEEPVTPWPSSTCPPYRVSPDASRFGDRASAARMARIVAGLVRNDTARDDGEPPRWFVMGDDDTVFFPDNLVAVLRKYDHEEMYYVGAPSESVEQDVMHSYGMAFGGGGFAVSYPAAAALAKAMDGCLDRYVYFYGSDQRVQACLTELGVPLTREPGFHQLLHYFLP